MIKTLIQKYVQHYSFLIAYSGGLDSTVLLYQFIKLKEKIPSIKFRTIHINHSMHKNANEWSKFCKKNCKNNQIEIVTETIKIKKSSYESIESNARKQRYKIIKKKLIQNEILVTAHNLDDQCETILLALKRGSGPTGLSSMPYLKKIGNNIHIRPLLYTSRKKIKLWAVKHNLKWIEDPTNNDVNFDRNFLRKKIIPLLQSKWTFFKQNCVRSAHLCGQETNVLLKIISKKTRERISIKTTCLNINNFHKLHESMRNLILRNWLFLNQKSMPSYKKTNQIYDKVISMPKHTNPSLSFRNYKIYRYKNTINIVNDQKTLQNTILFWKNTDVPLILPNNLGILKKCNFGMQIPIPNDKTQIINIRFIVKQQKFFNNSSKQKHIKNIWQEIGIPKWERHNIPFLYYNNKFIAAINYFSSFNQKQLDIKNSWFIQWIQENY